MDGDLTAIFGRVSACLRAYFNARTLSRIGSAGICPLKRNSAASHESRRFRPAIWISSYSSPRETQHDRTRGVLFYHVAFQQPFLDAERSRASIRTSLLAFTAFHSCNRLNIRLDAKLIKSALLQQLFLFRSSS